MYQPIVRYHLDEHDDWVAELGCLHFQHVRHKPPWQDREWVTSVKGREGKVGRMLNCVKCVSRAPADHGEGVAANSLRLPAGLAAYKTTPLFDQHNAPGGLQKEHATASGVWALLHVLSGSLVYCFSVESKDVSYEIGAAQPRVIVAEQPHFIVVDRPVTFQLEFYR